MGEVERVATTCQRLAGNSSPIWEASGQAVGSQGPAPQPKTHTHTPTKKQHGKCWASDLENEEKSLVCVSLVCVFCLFSGGFRKKNTHQWKSHTNDLVGFSKSFAQPFPMLIIQRGSVFSHWCVFCVPSFSGDEVFSPMFLKGLNRVSCDGARTQMAD